MGLSARLCFHLILPAILVPGISLPLVWGLAWWASRRTGPAERPWQRAAVALAVLDTVLAALLLLGAATGNMPGDEAMAVSAAPEHATGLFEPTEALPESGPAGPWALGALALFTLGVAGLWIAGRRRGVAGARFWLSFLGILIASVVGASIAAAVLSAVLGGVSLGTVLLALAWQAAVMAGLALWMRWAWARRGALQGGAGEPLSTPAAVSLGVLYLFTGAARIALAVGLAVAFLPIEAPSPADAPLQAIAQLDLEPIATGLFVATVVILGPVAEELLFRGVLLPWVARWMNPWIAAWVTGLLFALLHVHYGPFALVVALYGGVLGWARLRTRGLTAPILLHVAVNGAAAAALFAS